jgi:hypothetical protein
MATAKAKTAGSEPVSVPLNPPDATPAPRTPTPSNYGTGSVKHDPSSLAVAVRTNIPDPDSAYDWGVMTVDRGGHYAGWDDISGWNDLVVMP